MAFTVAITKSVFGNKRAHMLVVTADSAEDTIDTGLKNVEGFYIGAQDAATASVAFHKNKGSTGTALVGKIGISGVVSGEVYHLLCIGT
jgi:hypothetical protein